MDKPLKRSTSLTVKYAKWNLKKLTTLLALNGTKDPDTVDEIYTHMIEWLNTYHSKGILNDYTVDNFPRLSGRFSVFIVTLLQLFEDSE